MRKKIVAGNWKMNTSLQEGMLLIDKIIENETAADVIKIIAPPFVHLTEAARKLKGHENYFLAAQNCHHKPSGAYTGEIAPDMLTSAGATHVILGHSERRLYAGETNELLAEKVNIALATQLIPIFCIGESLEERNSNKQQQIVKTQLTEALFHLPALDFSRLIIAYEPVWAIGTGVTATSDQAQEMHAYIRAEIQKKYGSETADQISLLYGGSCNPQNAKKLFACKDIDGGLIGGASLKDVDFSAITRAF